MSIFLSIDEVVNLLGISKQAVHKNRRDEKYAFKEVKSKGGKDGISYEIALDSLPEYAQEKYRQEQANLVAENLPEAIKQAAAELEKPALPARPADDLGRYTEQQRDIDLAIKTIVRWIDAYPDKLNKAIKAINAGYEHKLLPTPVLSALDRSRLKSSGAAKQCTQALTLSTYEKWKIRFKKQGNYIPQLRGKDMSVMPWYESAIDLYCRPQKPTMEWVTEQLALTFKPAPSYWAVRRFLKEKYSAGELLKGRHTGMQLRALKYYRQRTADGMLPWDELHADGWATHFKAPHPITGEYVTLEVWDFHDVATRYVPPLAIGLSENYEVIAKGIENAIRDQGVMAILQTDSTKIVKKNTKFTGNPVLSISDRAGITIVHPVAVGNAQANGIAENWHAWMDKESRELATYQAKNMDSLSFKRTDKLTKKLVKVKAEGSAEEIAEASKELAKSNKGLLFESYEEACLWLESKRQKWNNHRHSSLKKIKDPLNGKMRHQTPQEALNEFKANGWQPHAMDEEQLIDLFRPRVQVKVRRGVVKPYGGMRFRHNDLDLWEGQDVVVAYDIMDYSQVWVTDMKGAAICIAPYDPACAYRAKTASEAATEKRAVATVRRMEKKIDTVKTRAGLEDNPALEGEAVRIPDIFISAEEVVSEPKISQEEFWASVPQEAPVAQVCLDWSEPEQEQPQKMSHQEGVMLLWGNYEEDEEDEDLETAQQEKL